MKEGATKVSVVSLSAPQEDVLSLISGGFDSGVSSYMLMRRGCRVHYCFFNLSGAAHEIGVRQVAHYLWNRFGSSHRVPSWRLTSAGGGRDPGKVDDGQMGVVLKRMMVRAASKSPNATACRRWLLAKPGTGLQPDA